MNCYLVITIDVEPDCTATWQYSNPLTFTGVTEGIGQKLHPLFEQYSMVPTYLINNVVMEDNESVGLFRSLKGNLELGAHLHPEFIRPDKLHSDYAGKKGVANCCFYNPEVEFEKVSSITSLFKDKFSYKPTSFRAGRFSAGTNTINSLVKLGYKADTSVTPHICWNDKTREIPVDFTSAPEQPYFIKSGTILEADVSGKLLQVPVSIALQKRNPVKELLSSAAGLRHPFRATKPLWLRPFYSSANEMIYITETYKRKYAHLDVVVLNMMFHNVEVLPGLSPYTKTDNDCKEYIRQLETYFSYCNANGIIGAGLSELYEILRAN